MDAKRFFDFKNGIYCYKKQVAVQATSPYYAIFISKAELGSKHDLTILEENLEVGMSEYLEKSRVEKEELGEDPSNNWSICCDKAYYKKNNRALPIRRITPKKGKHLTM